MALNLHLLRVFFEVARQRSFSRAAEKLFVSQPAVSKAVRELERQLGLPLVERSSRPGTRGVRLTESGEALFEHARGIFALERAAIEEVRARKGERRGRLALGASTTIAGYWLAPYLASMLNDAPQIDIQVRVGNTAAISRALIDCEIDIALVEGPVDDDRIAVAHWRDDPMCVAASASSSIARRRKLDANLLSEQTWLIRETGSGTREVAERLMQVHGVVSARTIEIWSNEGIARAVAAGLGVSVLPLCVVRELQAMRAIVALRFPAEASLSRPLYQLELRARPKSPLLKRFHEALRAMHYAPAAKRRATRALPG